MSTHYLPAYIARSMNPTNHWVIVVGAALVLMVGCGETGVGPKDELPVLSNPETSFNDRDRSFYAAVTVTLPESATVIDSVWIEMFQIVGGTSIDSAAADTFLLSISLVDDATNGDILPLDGVYARTFDSPLPSGTGGAVRFEFHALIAGDTHTAADTLRLINLRPVILNVSAAALLTLPPQGSELVAIDTVRATVADPDGLNDIKRVGFTVLKPDSTMANNGQPFLLADNGLLEPYGDLVAGDGVYSLIIKLESTNDRGTYVYRFTAQDLSGAVSDTVTQIVVVQ